MDDSPRPKQGSVRHGYYAPVKNTCTMTTDEEQTSLQEFENIVEVQSSGQESISTSGTSTVTSEAISAPQHGYDSISSSVNSHHSQYYSPLEPSYNIEMSRGSRNQLAPNNSVIVNSIHAYNRKRREPNNRMTQDIKQIRKRSKSEICGKGGKHVSTCRKQDMSEDKSLKLNASSQVTLDNSSLTSTDGQHIESNISISKIDQNGNAPRKISASTASKRGSIWSVDDILAVPGSIWSVDDILAVPGPSRFHGNQNEPKVLDKKLKSCNASKTHSVVPRRIITCMFCGEGIDKHTKIISGKTKYCCCVCKYTTGKTPNTLQKHFRIHCSKIECNECSREYTEGTLHVNQLICQLCSVTFLCRTQLDEHLLELHSEYFGKNCWECFEPVIAHYTRKEGKKLFFCCMCGYETNNVTNIQIHNKDHCPKYFCKICKEEYPEERKGFHNVKYSCSVCKEEFACSTHVEDHYKGFPCSEYFIEHCWLCNEIINIHAIDREEKQYYKCCECQYEIEFKNAFKNHLRKHTGLRLFKCETCDKRYMEKSSLKWHLKKCKPLPSLCKICGAKFPSDDSLNEHCLEKHKQTT